MKRLRKNRPFFSRNAFYRPTKMRKIEREISHRREKCAPGLVIGLHHYVEHNGVLIFHATGGEINICWINFNKTNRNDLHSRSFIPYLVIKHLFKKIPKVTFSLNSLNLLVLNLNKCYFPNICIL